jgi:leader peptidase (prepilin peptidase) / N-methyltransferase
VKLSLSEAWLRALVSLPFGLALGSFMTVVIARVPARESILRPRSKCARCGVEIRTRDNVPVLGWILLRGRCHACGERISVTYPLTELATALLVAGAIYTYDRVWIGVMVAALLALMPAITVIDIRHKLIPNAITYPAIIGIAVFIVVARLFDGGTDPARALLGMLAYGGGLFVLAMISRGMGMGDAKLAVVIGLVFGSIGLAIVGVAAGAAILLGGLGGVIALLMGRGRKARIPFGPYMAAGAVVAAFWGQQIADWYLRAFTAH